MIMRSNLKMGLFFIVVFFVICVFPDSEQFLEDESRRQQRHLLQRQAAHDIMRHA